MKYLQNIQFLIWHGLKVKIYMQRCYL
jgi:hypothetical protein